ncbi:MAG: 2Fe-2S iron-sulfur cluster-binding protein, partial [Methyloligellaceae bacterium]
MQLLNGGTLAQRLRLVSGLILFAFALTHFLNHAVGLISIDAMNVAQGWRVVITQSLLGGTILGLALIIHVALALAKLARRTTLRMPVWEAVQIILGLSIPYLLLPHMVATRLAQELFGVVPLYEYELVQLWPGKATTQSLLLLIVWGHGCVGLHFWLRLKRWYDGAFPYLFALAVLVPFAALAGFMVAGNVAAALYADPALFAELQAETNWPDAAERRTLILSIERARLGFFLLLGLTLLILAGQWIQRTVRSRLAITYSPGLEVRASTGPTLLEISRMNGIPHAAVCGGRARCSTCRVRIDKGGDALPGPEAAEAETLARIDAGPDVRLACQIRPVAPLTVMRLVNPTTSGGPHRLLSRGDAEGVERTCAVLFLDVRGFTNLS